MSLKRRKLNNYHHEFNKDGKYEDDKDDIDIGIELPSLCVHRNYKGSFLYIEYFSHWSNGQKLGKIKEIVKRGNLKIYILENGKRYHQRLY